MNAQEPLSGPAANPQPPHTGPGYDPTRPTPFPESRPPAAGDAPATSRGADPADAPDAAPAYVSRIQFCSATTKDGYDCGFAARRATGLCINHDPSYKEQQAENSRRGMEASLRRRRDARTFIPAATFDLGTRGGIQAAIETLLLLELSGRISPARSRNIARTLSLALRTQNRTADWRRFHANEYGRSRPQTLANLHLIADRLAAADDPGPRG